MMPERIKVVNLLPVIPQAVNMIYERYGVFLRLALGD
jgi:hypothetical protein